MQQNACEKRISSTSHCRKQKLYTSLILEPSGRLTGHLVIKYHSFHIVVYIQRYHQIKLKSIHFILISLISFSLQLNVQLLQNIFHLFYTLSSLESLLPPHFIVLNELYCLLFSLSRFSLPFMFIILRLGWSFVFRIIVSGNLMGQTTLLGLRITEGCSVFKHQ